MKLFRYRKPSLNTLLGITKAKKEIKKDLGVYKATRILNFPTNLKRRALRKIGYYSEPVRIFRNGLRKPGGCVISVITFLSSFGIMILYLWS